MAEQKSGTMRAALEAFERELDAAAKRLLASLPEGGFEHQTPREAMATTAAAIRLAKRSEAVTKMAAKILAAEIEARAEQGLPVTEAEVRAACGCPACQAQTAVSAADRPADPRRMVH